MTWDNVGNWEIDHIVPYASFDLTKKEEQEKCFHWTNLQPLLAQENRIKQAKISEEFGNIPEQLKNRELKKNITRFKGHNNIVKPVVTLYIILVIITF